LELGFAHPSDPPLEPIISRQHEHSFRDRIRAGSELIGSFVIELPTRATIECYAVAGFDFLVLDLEHSATDLSTLSLLIAACRSTGVASIVRIEADAAHQLTRVLDMAPDGVMVPGIRSASEAELVVQGARYYPGGRRGLAPIVRHALQPGAKMGTAGRDVQTVLALQIEAAEALTEAQDVAAMPGVDIVFIGPYDLSQSVGQPGELDHPDVLAAGSQLAARVASHAALGVYVERPEQGAFWRDQGATFFTLRTDGGIMLDGCSRTIAAWRDHAAEAAPGS
jgi:4-hydroxy-2-oxoheptanedioate aldolase